MICIYKKLIGYQYVVCITLLIVIIIVELPKYACIFSDTNNYALPCVAFSLLLMITAPFFLSRIIPTIAYFDKTWFPSVRSNWMWFIGMVIILILGGVVIRFLVSFHEDWFIVSRIYPILTDVKPSNIVLRGIILILFAPIAEEIFWRGFVLEQLRKLSPGYIALLINSFLFAFAHYPSIWLLFPIFFLYGMILGIWRIIFRSLVPIILAHIILNGVALLPTLIIQYSTASKAYAVCKEIDLLKNEPTEKAIPALIGFISHPDELVSTYAIVILEKNYRTEAEPYLKEAMKTNDKRTIDKVLFAVEWLGYLDLNPQVKEIAWSFNDQTTQLYATGTLYKLRDVEGVRDIAQRHPNEIIRRAARSLLGDEK